MPDTTYNGLELSWILLQKHYTANQQIILFFKTEGYELTADFRDELF
jgi:hypothetical protein